MKHLKGIALPATITIALLLVTLNVPASWFSLSRHNFGTVSLTDISGTDTLSAFPTVQNANNTILENVLNSIISTTTISTLTTAANLATVGTITSGTWSGTTIATTKGGTGLTAYATGDLIYGSGVNTLARLAASSSGEVLTLSGGVPVWSDAVVNTSNNYTWTGSHTFSSLIATAATTTNATTTSFAIIGTALHLNGTNYRLPAANTASTTMLSQNGSGSMSWVNPPVSVLKNDGTQTDSTGGTASTLVTIPANTLSTNKTLRITAVPFGVDGGTGDSSYTVQFGSGSATTTVVTGNNNNSTKFVNAVVYTQSSSAQTVLGSEDGGAPTVNNPTYSTAAKLYVNFTTTAGNGADLVGFRGATVELITQ